MDIMRTRTYICYVGVNTILVIHDDVIRLTHVNRQQIGFRCRWHSFRISTVYTEVLYANNGSTVAQVMAIIVKRTKKKTNNDTTNDAFAQWANVNVYTQPHSTISSVV